MKHPYSILDIPIGVCRFCNKMQTKLTKGGYWYKDKDNILFWYCLECRETRKDRYYPGQCESCSYNDITYIQFGYKCPRCSYFDV